MGWQPLSSLPDMSGSLELSLQDPGNLFINKTHRHTQKVCTFIYIFRHLVTYLYAPT